jgi:hypothetical protein
MLPQADDTPLAKKLTGNCASLRFILFARLGSNTTTSHFTYRTR